ncbi:MAG: DNA topoisomerase I, partial [Bdellovibrionales bacterium]|nr:DNA topoisomerase I [Bdellovibrionales bacterium]
ARRYSTKAKGAQEAHEAIRPSLDFTPPSDMGLRGREHDLYELIWMRTIATQMAESKQLQVSAEIEVSTSEGRASFHASGMKIIFPGFLMAYVEGEDDPEKALQERERFLPNFKEGDAVQHKKSEVTEHETKPPARYTEASLIQFLEKEGIGRPSTYASIVSTILDRGYAVKTSNALVPTFTGIVFTHLMSRHFSEFVDPKFTSRMEENLDDIAEGKLDFLPYLTEFYLGKNGLQKKVESEDKKIDPEEARTVKLDHLKNLDIYVGKFGPYFEYNDPRTREKVKASIPEALSPSELSEKAIQEIVDQVKKGATSLTKDPATGKEIFLKTGQYGPYVQLGDGTDSKEKVKRVSIPKGIDPATLDAQTAIAIINLPRTLGKHPASGKDVKAGVGRFGPYIVHEGDYRSLKKEDSVLTVDLARALELLAQPKGRRRGSTLVKDLGKSPDGEAVELLEGPYGLYIKHGKINATVPKESKPEDVTMEMALKLVAEKQAQGGGTTTRTVRAKRGGARGRKKSPASAEK